jgi:hypothetical protein
MVPLRGRGASVVGVLIAAKFLLDNNMAGREN